MSLQFACINVQIIHFMKLSYVAVGQLWISRNPIIYVNDGTLGSRVSLIVGGWLCMGGWEVAKVGGLAGLEGGAG